ncbi:Neutral amino acid permease [Lasiodiplodia theobromae]|uniref:Neutral amino acid permease n=1 Tax=Lasiodiplodia theobromae TaxID=45133 RepID=UPI0015C3FD08|nr:Neutral amino acid permease [Lasiodiplodia theobromae]KAF4543424.1 Neutral amino acid permease [Lasiodiplodia theobromae]
MAGAADKSEDEQLDELWQQARGEYERLTKRSLDNAARLTPQDLEAKRDEFSQSDRGELVKKSAEGVFQVAKFAAEAASSVFPAASMVITALSALGDTVHHYRANFIPKNVLEQLQRVEECLDRVEGYFRIYEQGIDLDPRLRATTMQILVETLRLCTIYTKVAQDSKSPTGVIKNLLKAAVRWDGGIASRLEEINEMSQRELNNNVAALRVSDIYTNDSKIRKANSEKLRRYLQVSGNEESWTDMQESLKTTSLPGMGDWLFELPEVKTWIDIDNHTGNSVLLIDAPSGHGKSHLCSRIIRSLEERRDRQQQKTRMSLAWYFFPEKHTEMGSDSKRKTTKSDETERIALDEALKSLVWQLAENDGKFQDFVIKTLEKSPAAQSNGLNIWNMLIMAFFKCPRQETQKPRKVVFLVLDGYGNLENQQTDHSIIKAIIEHANSRSRRSTQLRILLSGNKSFYNPNVHNLTATSFFEDDQRSDAKIFIKSWLDESHERWDSGSEGHRIFWGIRRDLVSDFTGNYHDLEAWLHEVRRSSDRGLSDLYNLQGEVRKGPEIITQRKLEMLNEELGSDDIEIFNELILCMVYWCTWPTVQQLNAYLSLRLGTKFKTSIDAGINDKFARLVSVENGRIVSSRLLGFFRENQITTLNITSDKGQHEDRHNSHEDSVAIPKWVVEYLCNRKPTDVINTDFIKFLVEKPTVSKPTIHFDPVPRALDTIDFFLQTMGQKHYLERAESKYLFEYTSIWLPDHMSDFEDELGNLPDERRKGLGEALYPVFMDEQVVETWMLKGDIGDFLWTDWPRKVRKAQKWLANDGVIIGFRVQANVPEDHSAIAQQRVQEDVPAPGTSDVEIEQEQTEGGAKSIQNEQPAIELYEILDAPSKVVASQWLQESRWPAIDALNFLLKIFREIYTSKQHSGRQTPSALDRELYGLVGDFLDGKGSGSLSPEQIATAEKWALSLLAIPEAQSRRNTTHDIRLAETFMGSGHKKGFEEAERRCELVKMRDPLDIKAPLCLSHALEKKNRTRQALDELLKIRHNIQSSNFRKSDPDTWQKELERFWLLCDGTNSSKEAFTACSYLSNEFPEETFPLDKAWEWIMKQDQLDASFEILAMKRRPGGDSILSNLFHSKAQSDDFHGKFVFAAQGHQRLVLETYEDAIKACKSPMDAVLLRYHYGKALYQCAKVEDALKAWEESLDLLQEARASNDNPSTVIRSLSRVAERLGSAYLEIVLNSKDTQSLASYVDKLRQSKTQIDEKHFLEVNYLSLLLARAYYVTGQRQKAVAAIENHLSTAFNLLEDDTDDNDWNGYFMLAEALILLEDDRNARAAWSLIVNVPDADRARDLSITCDGDCGWIWSGSSDLQKDIFICRNCPHMHFENDCHQLLLDNKLGHVCGSNHDFLQITKRKGSEVDLIKLKKVLVGKVEMKIDDWLAGLKCRYGIPSTELSLPSRAVEATRITGWKIRRQISTAMGLGRTMSSKLKA